MNYIIKTYFYMLYQKIIYENLHLRKLLDIFMLKYGY